MQAILPVSKHSSKFRPGKEAREFLLFWQSDCKIEGWIPLPRDISPCSARIALEERLPALVHPAAISLRPT